MKLPGNARLGLQTYSCWQMGLEVFRRLFYWHELLVIISRAPFIQVKIELEWTTTHSGSCQV
jgi:hypothetical protein